MKTKLLFLFLLISGCVLSQTANDTVIFTQQGHYYYNAPQQYSAYSPLIDRMNRPYIYTASIDLGMVTFDINSIANPFPVDTITPAMLNNLKATYLAQVGTDLFIACGGFQTSGERAGLSIYDMTNPLIPVLKDHWDSAAFTHGSAHIVVQGNYAYLAAMEDGILILDISNPPNIHFVKQIVPTNIPCAQTDHSRGLFLSHDTLLVANDCGGLRVISVTDPHNPEEIGAFTNVAAYGNGVPCYNKVWRIGDHAYIPMDYCGFEIDNVANPSAIVNEGIWNPMPCNNTNWFGSDVHANEIVSAMPTANVLMVSGGDSQVLCFDPTSTNSPRLMGAWGPANSDSLIAWGIDEWNGLVCSGYIRDELVIFQPYYGKKGGIQLLTWNLLLNATEQNIQTGKLDIFPNPVSEKCTMELPISIDKSFTIEVFDVMGKILLTAFADPKVNGRNVVLDLSEFANGIYFVRVTSETMMYSGRVVKK
jgi:hypothetical protein